MCAKTLTIEAMPIIAREVVSTRATGRLVTALAIAGGTAAALYFARHDLTLSHYDARAHLVVARRVTDSLTPGWRQIGALWLPLPHLLNLIPVALWWNYQTGGSAVAWSILTFAAGLGALSGYLQRHTRSTVIAIVSHQPTSGSSMAVRSLFITASSSSSAMPAVHSMEEVTTPLLTNTQAPAWKDAMRLGSASSTAIC